MLDPKEKAEELVLRFIQDTCTDRYMGIMQAKECAKIAVKECLQTCVESSIYYWKEVLTEIDNL